MKIGGLSEYIVKDVAIGGCTIHACVKARPLVRLKSLNGTQIGTDNLDCLTQPLSRDILSK